MKKYPEESVTISQGVQLEGMADLIEDTDYIFNKKKLKILLDEKGYLFIRGFHPRKEVEFAKNQVLEILHEAGKLAVDSDWHAGKFRAPHNLLGKKVPGVEALLYGKRTMQFFDDLFGEPSRHFDFTWLRAMPPKMASKPHCDIVYMGRGTDELLTTWTPLDDIFRTELGGLMILENSHQTSAKLGSYLDLDVDSYCENSAKAQARIKAGEPIHRAGHLGAHPQSLPRRLGGRWLTADFEMGDLLIFGMKIVHCSLDNQSDRFRISVDSRYQPASQAIDERWIGEKPIGHSLAGARGRVC
ncbi:MAG: phytanoyl-CoA dioxygenase family protein [Opitutales bacterium]|nr:phytanoyl-CoA dioxygenase family protein [Opitutales bacterium]